MQEHREEKLLDCRAQQNSDLLRLVYEPLLLHCVLIALLNHNLLLLMHVAGNPLQRRSVRPCPPCTTAATTAAAQTSPAAFWRSQSHRTAAQTMHACAATPCAQSWMCLGSFGAVQQKQPQPLRAAWCTACGAVVALGAISWNRPWPSTWGKQFKWGVTVRRKVARYVCHLLHHGASV